MENKTVIAIIQAHMSSSRLPGKVMMNICGEPALYRMLERVKRSKRLDDIVVATSTMECDDVIVDKCHEWGVHTFRGSNSDVLSRYWWASREYPADIYVRLTSDCPLICAEVINDTIDFYMSSGKRYVSTLGFPNGVGAEVFSAELLKEDYENAKEPFEHEHVTPYMYLRQGSIGRMKNNKACPEYRITLDTAEDYKVRCAVYNELYPKNPEFSFDDIIAFLNTHPEVVAINSMIKQKGLMD